MCCTSTQANKKRCSLSTNKMDLSNKNWDRASFVWNERDLIKTEDIDQRKLEIESIREVGHLKMYISAFETQETQDA